MSKYHMGPLIRKIRQARGIGVTDFSEQIGTNTGNLSRFERGHKGGTTFPDCMYLIAEALGTSVPALFLLKEICWADPSIPDRPEVLLAHLNRVTHEIERLAWRKLAGGSLPINSNQPKGRINGRPN